MAAPIRWTAATDEMAGDRRSKARCGWTFGVLTRRGVIQPGTRIGCSMRFALNSTTLDDLLNFVSYPSEARQTTGLRVSQTGHMAQAKSVRPTCSACQVPMWLSRVCPD